MLRFILAAVILSVATCQRDHDQRCEFIVHLDCSTFGMQDICASDNKTYVNHCDMAKAHCLSDNLHQVHEGACGSGANANPINGHEVSFRIYCYAMLNFDCGDDHEFLCGTDNQTYSNVCSFEKAKCQNENLDVKYLGACK